MVVIEGVLLQHETASAAAARRTPPLPGKLTTPNPTTWALMPRRLARAQCARPIASHERA